MVGATLVSLHNLHTLLQLAADMRQAILEGRFQAFVHDYSTPNEAAA
jgi:tRNA-guanine family transglycosylase